MRRPCVKPWTRPEHIPRSDNDKWLLKEIDKIFLCAATQPWRLPTEHGKRPRTSTRNWKVPTKSRTVSKILRRGQSLKKSDRHNGETSLPIPIDGLANRVWTGVRTHHASTPFINLRGNRQNRHRGEWSEDDWAIWPCGTHFLIDRTIGKGEIICAIRTTDYLQRHDGFQRDNTFGAYGGFQRQHLRVDMSDHRPEDVDTLWYFFHQSYQ